MCNKHFSDSKIKFLTFFLELLKKCEKTGMNKDIKLYVKEFYILETIFELLDKNEFYLNGYNHLTTTDDKKNNELIEILFKK